MTKSRYTNEELLKIEEEALANKDNMHKVEMKLAREWWLSNQPDGKCHAYTNIANIVYVYKTELIHVVEYDYAQQLEERCKELEAALKIHEHGYYKDFADQAADDLIKSYAKIKELEQKLEIAIEGLTDCFAESCKHLDSYDRLKNNVSTPRDWCCCCGEWVYRGRRHTAIETLEKLK